MNVGISGIITPSEWSFEETMQKISAAGYESFELCFRDGRDTAVESLTDARIKEMVRIAADHGIRLASAVGSGELRPDIMSNDWETRRRSMEQIKSILDIVARLGIDTWLLVPGRVSETCHYDDAYFNAVTTLRKLVPAIEEIGVTVAIEYVWNRFLLSPLEWVRFLGDIGSEKVGLYFDTGNLVIQSYPEQWVKIVGHGVKKVHLKDFQRQGYQWKPLLQGDVDFAAVMAELRKIGYDDALLSEVSLDLASLEETAAAIRQIMAL